VCGGKEKELQRLGCHCTGKGNTQVAERNMCFTVSLFTDNTYQCY